MTGRRGISLLEVVIVMALLSVGLALSYPYYKNFIAIRSVEFWMDMIVSDLNRCKNNTLREERCWGIRITGNSSYELVTRTDDGSPWIPSIKRFMDRDFSGTTKFDNVYPPTVIYFEPTASIEQQKDGHWVTVGIRENGVTLSSERSITLISGTHKRYVKITETGNFFSTE